MNKKYTRKNVKIEELILDKTNPRFAELYNGSNKENEIIEYLLNTESAEEIVDAISDAQEFYEDRPLWVIENDGKYLVKDGNRRCSAVKALQDPEFYELSKPKFEIKELPVLVYKNLADLETRIRLEHNSNLFKKWGRIAKAIEIYRLFLSGNTIESLMEIDSKPKDFIKTASFYYKAVSLKGEDFKKLVREGRGKNGGKTIIFERLFREKKLFGYSFKNTGELLIKDKEIFESYINAVVPYLIDNPDTTSRTLDGLYKKGESFLELLKPFGFPPEKKKGKTNDSQKNSNSRETNNTSLTGNNSTETKDISSTKKNSGTNDSTNTSGTSNSSGPSNGNNSFIDTKSLGSSNSSNSRHSVKKKPSLRRKKIPGPLKSLIDECYSLNQNDFANSKTALTRVTFECVLKFIVEDTKKTNGKPLANSNHFQTAYKKRNGDLLPHTNFTSLKIKFTELIIHTATRKAFEVLDLEIPHQIIHNYKVGAIPKQAKDLCDNLIDIIEFMLQNESDLKASLDLSKL
jgi:hypothetical protein